MYLIIETQPPIPNSVKTVRNNVFVEAFVISWFTQAFGSTERIKSVHPASVKAHFGKPVGPKAKWMKMKVKEVMGLDLRTEHECDAALNAQYFIDSMN
jgi:hypothetical protein